MKMMLCNCGEHAWSSVSPWVVLVSPEDIVMLHLWTWRVNKSNRGRVTSVQRGNYYKDGTRYLHREILQAVEGQEVDHANRNPLDNRRENIRFCTRAQNQQNRGGWRLGLKGVFKCAASKSRPWRAQLLCNGIKIRGPRRSSEQLAHADYLEMAKSLHGDFEQKKSPGPR